MKKKPDPDPDSDQRIYQKCSLTDQDFFIIIDFAFNSSFSLKHIAICKVKIYKYFLIEFAL